MNRRVVFITDNKTVWKTTIYKLKETLRVQGYKVLEVPSTISLSKVLHESEQNIVIFSFCLTESSKNKVIKILDRGVETKYFPLITVMPYREKCLLVKCFTEIYIPISMVPQLIDTCFP